MSEEEAEEHNDLSLPPDYGLGVYTIQKSLGQGGFGITYLAYDTSLDTEVVIKESMPSMFAGRSADSHQVFTLSRSSEDFAWALDRFLMEARTLAKLNHRNIVRVMRVFEALGTAYYVMPYLGDSSLDKVLEKEGPLPEERITALLALLLNAAVVGDASTAGLLIEEHGANPDVKDNTGNTPLILAAYKGHGAVVKLLLDKGANINATNMYGATAADTAGNDSVREILLSYQR